MKRTLFALLALPFLAFGQAQKGVQPITQSTAQPTGQTRAVVIGISDYQEKDIPDLRFADKDAEAFANYLRSPAGGSLDNDHLQILTNEKATAGRVAEALDALVEQTKEGDQVIIYFSGHGDVERKTISQPGFLLCWDSPARVYMGGGTYSLAFLQEIVSTLSVQNKAKVLVVTDACHAGKLAGSQIGGSQATAANLAKQFANEVKILSCQPNEFSLEGEQWGGGRGIFSYHLVDGLFGLADHNGDGSVTVGEIDRYLEDHVTAEAAPQSQVPMLLGNKTERLATVNAQILAALQKAKAGGMPVFAATEGRGFEEDILAKADSSVREQYLAFKKAVREKRFFRETENVGRVQNPSDVGQPADELYAQLAENESLAPLRGMMKRNYAAALQDDAQQVLNTMLKTGLTEEILKASKAAVIYKNYPAYIDRAAQLLGSTHYLYPILQARKYFFKGMIAKNAAEKRLAFRNALHFQADMGHALVYMAKTFDATQADSVEYYATQAAALNPSWVEPFLTMAAYYRQLKNYPKAEEMLNRATSIDSNSILVWYERARYFHHQAKFSEAEKWYLKALDGSGRDICFPCVNQALGDIYLSNRQFDKAEQYLKNAVLLDSVNLFSINTLGVVYEWSGRFQEAAQQYLLCIGIDSTFVPAWMNMGNLNFRRDKLDEVEPFYKKALLLPEQDRSHFKAHFGLGLLDFQAKKYADAEEHWMLCFERDSSNANLNRNLGKLYFKTNRFDIAQQRLMKAIQLRPTDAAAMLGMAYVLASKSKTADALGYVEQAIGKGSTFEQLESDEDLAPLRTLPEWKVLMKKHFPDKVKD